MSSDEAEVSVIFADSSISTKLPFAERTSDKEVLVTGNLIPSVIIVSFAVGTPILDCIDIAESS